MAPNLPEPAYKRIVIAGGGFAGLRLARSLRNTAYQVVLLDKNNYHQFQPLLYQVATAGLEPSAIAFPFRKIFHHLKNIHFRYCEVMGINPAGKEVLTSIGNIPYDLLVLAMGVDTNYYGNENLLRHVLPMKSVSEALTLRNRLLQNYEQALISTSEDERESLMNIVVAGGGPTGVEISGTLAEMRKTVFPKDFPELSFNKMRIILLEGGPRLLNGMSERSGFKALQSLQKMGVEIRTNTLVHDFDGTRVTSADGQSFRTTTVIWAAGVTGKACPGLPAEVWTRQNRIRTDAYLRVTGLNDVFALGDIAAVGQHQAFAGHPQLAQPAIQQAALLASNLKRELKGRPWKAFRYRDPGSLATIGRHKAVAEFRLFRFNGPPAWLLWLFIHLMAIVGVKNRLFIFLNWLWAYVTYDQSLRLILKNKE
ncbi:MAG TPA: NAD(P)/FAD-dependent oxidoreductase [Bacteroidales bacterium]|nr:NAD(P)/FAD-dependent oxidoreductase [Bacteroidales bacterium]HSA42506.1 NAD(P)/FAD-dependent oxidoreductase [Bacteroidales bacterium]